MINPVRQEVDDHEGNKEQVVGPFPLEDGEEGLGQKEDEDILQFGLAKEAGKGVAWIEQNIFQHLTQAFLAF